MTAPSGKALDLTLYDRMKRRNHADPISDPNGSIFHTWSCFFLSFIPDPFRIMQFHHGERKIVALLLANNVAKSAAQSIVT